MVILVNPTAGAGAAGQQVDQLRRRLEQAGLSVETVWDIEALRRSVGQPRDRSLRAVVAAGGDGTVSAVVNATPPETPITVLPLGTENLLAKYVEHPFSLSALCHAIVHGASVAVDAGRAGDRLFLLMVGCGFDAHVVHGLHQRRRGPIRHAAYIKPILDAIRRYEYPEIRVWCAPSGEAARSVAGPDGVTGGGAWSVLHGRWVFVVNIPKYAGGLRIMPEARGDDGLLDICLFQRGSWLQGVRYLTGILRGRHQRWPDCRRVMAARIRIESDGEVPYQLDGDPGGLLPVDVAIVPARVRLVVTEGWAQRHGFRHAGQGEEAAVR